jgi:2-oxoglutarate/2-oxoacid ferredoxin oxidoreductase subunit beta
MTAVSVNAVGLRKQDYRGAPSTLCAGCGHDSVTNQIITAAFDLGIRPETVLRMSGIGCSSKSAAYMLGRSHGFNAIHGRMPSVTTGAHLANHSLKALAVSGDGDTASIGLGQFLHLLRRNVPMVYIVENNGVYGLTKGQFSATADQGQTLRHAGTNALPPIDVCAEAVLNGCGFVARSFAGDARQLRELLKAAFQFDGTAVIDVISPCVTFNNHETSTKSYAYGKAHEQPLHDITFVPHRTEITVDYEPGTVTDVALHDASVIRLRKLTVEYDPTDRLQALLTLERARADREFVTGLLYLSTARPTLAASLGLQTPLATLTDADLRPSVQGFEELIDRLCDLPR